MDDTISVTILKDPSSSSDPISNAESFLGNSRFQVCRLLKDSNITHCIWAEDALAFHGIPTVVFALYLLTEDISAAAQLLVENGYTKRRCQKDYLPIPEFSERYFPTDATDDNSVVLLSPSDWNYDMADNIFSRMPPFSKLLNFVNVQVDG